MRHIKKIKFAVISLIILSQFAGLVFAYSGFADLMREIGFFDGKLEGLVKAGKEGTEIHYEWTKFMKDLYVNAGVHSDFTLAFLLIAFAGVIVYFFCLLKSRVKK